MLRKLHSDRVSLTRGQVRLGNKGDPAQKLQLGPVLVPVRGVRRQKPANDSDGTATMEKRTESDSKDTCLVLPRVCGFVGIWMCGLKDEGSDTGHRQYIVVLLPNQVLK
jgi:hypothetical protein